MISPKYLGNGALLLKIQDIQPLSARFRNAASRQDSPYAGKLLMGLDFVADLLFIDEADIKIRPGMGAAAVREAEHILDRLELKLGELKNASFVPSDIYTEHMGHRYIQGGKAARMLAFAELFEIKKIPDAQFYFTGYKPAEKPRAFDKTEKQELITDFIQSLKRDRDFQSIKSQVLLEILNRTKKRFLGIR